jgi:3-phenylpropionate/trans-cinnamate dioxygenase ferredoxin subunit
MKMVQVDGTDILVVHDSAGAWHATQGICTHEYFELDKGFLTDDTLTCALHLSRFDLTNGEALDGQVVLELPDGPIPVNE